MAEILHLQTMLEQKNCYLSEIIRSTVTVLLYKFIKFVFSINLIFKDYESTQLCQQSLLLLYFFHSSPVFIFSLLLWLFLLF